MQSVQYFEIETQLIAVEKLGLVSKEKLSQINEMVNEEEKMLNGLISSLKGRNH
jgi:four helix bundle protein